MEDITFWEIVGTIEWPNIPCDEAKYRFMCSYSINEAEDFRNTVYTKSNELVKVSGSDMCCDSWDDTISHIIGLGEEQYNRNIEKPELILEREKCGDYEESFLYCIPYNEDYDKLTDDGYLKYIDGTNRLVDELRSVNEDEIPPTLYRQIPKIIEVAQLLCERNWEKAVEIYNSCFGSGYAERWPLAGRYCIPNFIQDLKRYRLRKKS